MPFDASTTHAGRRTFLPRLGTLVLDNAKGTVIAVDRGCLWVTLERDPRDVILVGGMRFLIDREGRTVIAAEADSRLRLLKTRSAGERITAAIGRAASGAITAWTRRLARQTVPYF